MKVKLLGNNQIINTILPSTIYGNYWIYNEDNENLINIEAENNKWYIKSNLEVKIKTSGGYIDKAELIENNFYTFFDEIDNKEYRIFVCPTYNEDGLILDFLDTGNLNFCIGNIGKNENGKANYISYENDNIAYNQIQIIRTNGIYYFKNLNPNINTYVNNFVIKEGYLKYGDILFIEGMTISFVGNMLALGTVFGKVKYAKEKFTIHQKVEHNYEMFENDHEKYLEVFDKNEYFVRPPRFNEIIEEKEINIDNPPKSPITDTGSMILTILPMMIMGMSTSIAGVFSVIRVANGEASFKDNASTIITAGCMLTVMLIFPLITNYYQKHREKKHEKERQIKYSGYLKKVEEEVVNECTRQKRVLIENNVSLSDVGDIIIHRKRNLWERKIIHNDFLSLRLGIGNVKPKIKVNYQKEHFEMETDTLEANLRQIVKTNDILTDVPVILSFREKYISALIGKYEVLKRYMDGLLLQMIAYHSYDELKIVIFTNEKNESYWDKLKNSPYIWNQDKTFRFFGSNIDDITKISNILNDEYNARDEIKDDERKIFSPHYIIITDDIALTSKIGIINRILSSNSCKGFSLLYLTDKLNSLPSECSTFISIDPSIGGVFENELVNKKQEFKPDFTTTTIDSYIYGVSNIPIETSETLFELPNIYSFLEMYDVGSVNQLNAYNRWQKNDPTTSLSCPVGIDTNGDLFKLDLHEKVHGPHGLIAGMTGSGKSEFIITYILSMAVNYHPDEVQFVLIDYKGGGLAGAFENKETGEKLPHLAGTITNLDTNEINRSLSSLQSELKRRQKVFNDARDKCNESTIDIYKYQKLYREGKVKEPVSHLIIISDEFAELKSQQPEFMDELISAARIGRSLGVHLVLATQKPSGVVDEQIWSNSKFRVCLKVQDKADSNDMIKNADAAYLKETGRFYLQVGFNEFFAKGQSAWCGAPYFETDKRKKIIDSSLTFIDNTGEQIKSIDNNKQDLRGIHKGEEISNVLNYLENIGKEQKINVRQLWLDQIPGVIFVDKLKKKYSYIKQNYIINPLIGEYDAPLKQEQGMLTIPFTKEGNLIIYGSVGSGKENLVSTIIYSLITTYSPSEVNIYVLDFGSEALRMYSKAPHIGSIVSSSEKDQITTMFKLLKDKIESRKKLFSEYNGNYEYYCKNSGKTVPTIITIINGLESFNELYPDFADDLVLLTREGQKYGILFITTVSATNNIRMKLSQNFNQKLVLQMNDPFDYRQILGKTEVIPNKIIGRGLAKVDDIYEFQSAYPCEISNIASYIKNIINKLTEMYPKKASAIPTLPEKVTTSFVMPELNGLAKIPVGISKNSLNIEFADLKNQTSLLITSQKLNDTSRFVNSFIYELKNIANTSCYVIDAERLLNEKFTRVNYFTSSFEKVFTSFKNIVDDFNQKYINADYDSSVLNSYGDMVFVIIGINKIKTILGTKFDEIVALPMQNSKKLNKISYVFVDTFDNLKKLEYDGWYKDIVNNTRGIWIGNGLAEQSVLKINSSMRSISNELPNSFGYNIISGIPTLIKYVESIDEDLTKEES